MEDVSQGALRRDGGDRLLHRRGSHVRRLVRYVVWFVIDLESRRVHIAGLTRHLHDAWIQQGARNLTDSVDGFLRDKRYLIHDRDPPFTEAFRAILRATGIKCLKLLPPAQI
jgi:hypothetical protein